VSTWVASDSLRSIAITPRYCAASMTSALHARTWSCHGLEDTQVRCSAMPPSGPKGPVHQSRWRSAVNLMSVVLLLAHVTSFSQRRSEAQLLRSHGAAEAVEQGTFPGQLCASTNDRPVLVLRLTERGLVERVPTQHGLRSQSIGLVLSLVAERGTFVSSSRLRMIDKMRSH